MVVQHRFGASNYTSGASYPAVPPIHLQNVRQNSPDSHPARSIHEPNHSEGHSPGITGLQYVPTKPSFVSLLLGLYRAPNSGATLHHRAPARWPIVKALGGSIAMDFINNRNFIVDVPVRFDSFGECAARTSLCHARLGLGRRRPLGSSLLSSSLVVSFIIQNDSRLALASYDSQL